MTKSTGIGLSGIDDVIGPLFCGLYDLGALHHPLCSGPGLFNEVIGLMTSPGKEFFTFFEQPARRSEFFGKRLERFIDEPEYFVFRDH